MIVWFTGLPSSGKTTLGREVYSRLRAENLRIELLDGDAMRQQLGKDLGFSKDDREENIRRIAYVAGLLARNGIIVLVSAISPYRSMRDEVRRSTENFVEVFVNAPIGICELRDVKGLYRKARIGELTGLTGIDDPYEPPPNPEVECRTDIETVLESAEKVLQYILPRLLAVHQT